MKIDEKYDYIICGGGATGLLLSHSLISDTFFDNKKVLVIEKEIKIRVVSAIDYKTKVRPIGHVGRSVLSLRDQLEGSDPIPDVICMLRDGEWWKRIHDTPCLDVGEQAMRFQRGEAALHVIQAVKMLFLLHSSNPPIT